MQKEVSFADLRAALYSIAPLRLHVLHRVRRRALLGEMDDRVGSLFLDQLSELVVPSHSGISGRGGSVN